MKTVISVPKKATSLEVDLEKQLQAWRENPSWADQPPDIKVRDVLPSTELVSIGVGLNWLCPVVSLLYAKCDW